MTDLTTLFTDLVRFQIDAWNQVDSRLRAAHELPLGSFETLRVIDETDGCRVFDISERMAITVGGTSKIVDRLENSGFVERRANPDDRRSSLLALTASGTSVLARAIPTYEAALAEVFDLPATQLDRLAATLSELRSR